MPEKPYLRPLRAEEENNLLVYAIGCSLTSIIPGTYTPPPFEC